MLYLNLSDNSIEMVQTSKGIVGGEKVKACSRKAIPEGIIVNGLIVTKDKFLAELKTISDSGYPKAIRDKNIAVVVSDKQVFTYKSKTIAGENVDSTEVILQEVKKALPYDPAELENFYKIFTNKDGGKEYFYTAMSKNTILHFANLLKQVDLHLVFISSRSLSLFELLRSEITRDEKILYCNLEKKTIEYFLYDEYSPIEAGDKKIGSKSIISEVQNLVRKVEEEKNLKISKLLIGGEGSLEIPIKEITDEIQVPVVKMGELIDTLVLKTKIDIDTGGIPKMLFVNCLGAVILAQSKSPPNFAKDLAQIKEVLPMSDEKNVGEETEKTSLQVKSDTEAENIKPSATYEKQMISEQIVEQKKLGLMRLFNNNILVMILSFVATVVVIIGLLIALSKKANIQLPFISTAPSPTPIPTIEPTITPTPTIDPKLKRGDLKVSIQNGTDKTGYAKETADFLEGKGYKNIAKSNADKDNYEKTIIKVKDSKKNYLPLLSSDLKDKFDTSTAETLDVENKYDVIVILGKK